MNEAEAEYTENIKAKAEQEEQEAEHQYKVLQRQQIETYQKGFEESNKKWEKKIAEYGDCFSSSDVADLLVDKWKTNEDVFDYFFNKFKEVFE